MDFLEIGQVLKRRRTYLGLSQKDLSEKANCRLNSISELEVGYDLSVDVFQKVCDALMITPDYVFSFMSEVFLSNAIAVYCTTNGYKDSCKTLNDVLSLLGEE